MFLFEDSQVFFLIILAIIALLYGSVGHGGATGYLALMAIFNFSPLFMKPTALLLNLVVAGIAFIQFWRAGFFKKNLFFPFAITSIPAAFLGGLIEVDAFLYKKILAVFLILAIVKMIPLTKKKGAQLKKLPIGLGLIIGLAIGFFSGLIGIGGGIILSPIILLFNWGKIKEAAAVSALFIWVNSFAGISGQFIKGLELNSTIFVMILIVTISGFIGGYLGSKKINSKNLNYLLSLILLIASIKLFLI
tara:strand:+ start:420 stop:1163 length:744 start_codon:yes stop_codon:yes gene_type:complete